MAHAGLARTMGVKDDHILVCEDGDQLVLTDAGIERRDDAVPAGYLYVDGIVGDVGGGVLRDRKVLAEEGVVVVVVTVDAKSGAIVTGPEVITRGWVYAPEAEDLLDGAREAVVDAIKQAFAKDAADIEALAARRAPNGRSLRQRADQAPADDRPGRDGDLRPLMVVDREPQDEGGDAACWAHLVCPECGAVTDGSGTHQLPGCV